MSLEVIYQQGIRVICAQTQTIGAVCSKEPTKSCKWCFENTGVYLGNRRGAFVRSQGRTQSRGHVGVRQGIAMGR